MNIEYTPDWLFIKTEIPKEKHILKNVLNAQELKKGFRVPKHIWGLRELLRYFPYLKEDAALVAEGKTLRERLDYLVHLRSHGKDVSSNVDNLRPYQWQDVMFLKEQQSAGIFNEPRTGKTPTTITLIKNLGTKRNLIVAPASLIWNWAKEFKTWYPECAVFIYDRTNKKVPPHWNYHVSVKNDQNSVMIISKDTLKLDVHQDKGFFDHHTFDVTIVDEAHYLRNYKSAQAKAVFAVNTKRKYALTGTPSIKHAADIWGILHFLNPKQYPSYWQFVDRYFQQSEDWMGHKVIGDPKPERVNELQEIIALGSVQRKRKEVMQWLPDKQRSTFNVQMDTKQQKLYDEMAKYFSTSDGDTDVDTSSVITQLMRLRQLCLDPRLLGFETPGAKTEAILEYLENHREPIVIMSMFTSYLKLLKPLIEKLGLKVGFIHGEMSNQQKQQSATHFQIGKTDVLLCNIISAGTGFTLDNAERIIFTDKAWNPSENLQAEDRICPTTKEKNHKHEIISFVCQDTVDQRIDEILEQKLSLTDYINKGGQQALRRLLGK